MAFPALTQTRSSRMNKPYENNTTQLNLSRSVIFALIQHLIDTATGGTLTGTRNANSVWTVKGSSNSASVSLVGVNHIAARTDLVWAADATNHSWIWLENATIGYQLVIDCTNATSTNICIATAPIATPFTGGTLSTRPTSTEEFLWGTTSTGAAVVDFLPDVTTGATCNTHFVTGTDGQFTFWASRAGTGLVFLAIALQKTVNPKAADTRNVFWVGNALASGRGACQAAALFNTTSGCVGRTTNGAVVASTGGAQGSRAGGTDMIGSGSYTTDAIDGKYDAVGCPVWTGNSGALYAFRGLLPDVYTTNAAVGEPISLAGVVTRTVIGDTVWPCPGVAPTV